MFRLLRPDRRTLINSLIEAMLIIFSVLVALAANRWRGRFESQQRLQDTERNIRVELQDNRAILRTIIPYHEEEVRRIGQFLAQPNLMDKVKGRSMRDLQFQLLPHGFWDPPVSPSQLTDAAWRTAVADGTVSLMNVQLLSKLTQYYSQQNIGVEHMLQLLPQQLLTPQYFDPKSTVLMLRTVQGWFSIMAPAEKDLLSEASEALDALPAPHKAIASAKSNAHVP